MEDISSVIKELSDAFSNNDIPDNLKEIINNIKNNQNVSVDNSQNTNNQENNNDTSTFNIDMIFKAKKIMDEMNNNNNDPRKSLLLSLKPYLKEDKKEKVDQYIKFLSLSKAIEIIGPEFLGSDKNV